MSQEMRRFGTKLNKSAYRNKLVFQKCLYFNLCLFFVWIFVIGLVLAHKINKEDYLGKLTRYLAVTVYTLLLIIEGVRLTLGQIASTRNRVPEMGGFLLITTLMQLPLVSFFLFNPYLHNRPAEIILSAFLWLFAIIETVYGYMELKHISAIASSIYYSQFKSKNVPYCISIER